MTGVDLAAHALTHGCAGGGGVWTSEPGSAVLAHYFGTVIVSHWVCQSDGCVHICQETSTGRDKRNCSGDNTTVCSPL